MSRHFVLAITGASGAIFGLRLCRALLDTGTRVTLLITSAGHQVLNEECGLHWTGSETDIQHELREYFQAGERSLFFHAQDDFRAPIASGSSAPDGMIVCPCSMGTLARIAAGISGNLLERCADVVLKERRTLVLVPRETPLNTIHLENMLKLSRLGAMIVPPMPAFYHHPSTIEDMVDFIAGKILAALGFDQSLFRSWGEQATDGVEPARRKD